MLATVVTFIPMVIRTTRRDLVSSPLTLIHSVRFARQSFIEVSRVYAPMTRLSGPSKTGRVKDFFGVIVLLLVGQTIAIMTHMRLAE